MVGEAGTQIAWQTITREQVEQAFAAVETMAAYEEIFAQYLGKKGAVSAGFASLKSASPEDKKARGGQLSGLKTMVTEISTLHKARVRRQEIEQELNRDVIDAGITARHQIGFLDVLSQVRRRAEDIAVRLGLDVVSGHHLVSAYENFESVNIPLTHPATEMHDSFYVDAETVAAGSSLSYVMRTHTSAHQSQYLRTMGPAISLIIPGRTYRNEKMDATHDTAFRQVEGMVVDRDISIADFRGFINQFLREVFGREVQTRLRPAYFPFVEPGFEIDARVVDGDYDSGWIELLGAGMVHPNVLRHGDVDPDEYSGFAFGIGITRLAALHYGLRDIRLLTSGDMRFAHSFA